MLGAIFRIGGGEIHPLDFKMSYFPVKFLAKNVVFLVSSG